MGLNITLPTPGDIATSGTWGTTLNSAINALNADQFKLKTANDTRTTTTLTDDTHLASMTLGAGTWLVEVGLLADGPQAGDIKVAWAFSGTTTTAVRGGAGPSSGVTGTVLTASIPRFAAAGDTAGTITASTSYGLDGTNWSWIIEKGVLVVTVSGTFKVQTAQLAASGTTTVRTGSYAWARQVA